MYSGALGPDSFDHCQVFAPGVRFGVERAALAIEETQMRMREQLLNAARARFASNLEERRFPRQLVLDLNGSCCGRWRFGLRDTAA